MTDETKDVQPTAPVAQAPASHCRAVTADEARACPPTRLRG